MLETATADRPAAVTPWGMMAAIDLHDCDRERLADPETIRRFVPLVISSLTIHADEFSGRYYVDVFSCKAFDPELAAAIAVEHFGGWPRLTVLHR
jgi:hypothetical protein